MNKLPDYVIGNPYFGKAELVSVEDIDDHEVKYYCPEMEAICLEIDGYFYAADSAHELDRMRRSKYYLDLVRQRNEHKCLHPDSVALLHAATCNPELAKKFAEALRNR